MPLLTKNINDDRRYTLLMRSRHPSVSEIDTTNNFCKDPSLLVSSPMSPRRRRRRMPKSSVHFDEMVIVRETIGLHQLSPKEHNSTWYTRKELKDIKMELAFTVKLMTTNELDHTNEHLYCSRGAEIRTSAGCAHRKNNKRLGWDCVLREQNRQHEETGAYNHDAQGLATLYSKTTLPCRKAALMNGLRDELNVLRERRQEEEEERKRQRRKVLAAEAAAKDEENSIIAQHHDDDGTEAAIVMSSKARRIPKRSTTLRGSLKRSPNMPRDQLAKDLQAASSSRGFP